MGHKLFPTRDAAGNPISVFQSTVVALPPNLDDTLPPGVPSAGDSSPADMAIDFGFDGAADESAVAAEPTLSHIGRYALKHRLAEGGLGTVWEAWDPLLSRAVAVKTLQFKVSQPSRIALDGIFLNEARTAAGLSHRYIVTVHDAGLSAHGVYIAMERLHGRDLRQALDAGWLPGPDRAAQIARRVADALAYAHARGVVHCDIKPGNIFLTRRHRPKVLDFGIARAAGVAAPELDGFVAGSPHYLAPEQLDGGAIDARTDVYALGVVLYELLSGCKAFPGPSLDAIAAAVRAGQPAPLQPPVPAGLAQIVARATALSPADRYPTAGDFSQALRHWSTAQEARPAAAAPTKHNRRADDGRPASKAAWAAALALLLASAAVALQAVKPTAATPAVAPAAGPAQRADQSGSAPARLAVQPPGDGSGQMTATAVGTPAAAPVTASSEPALPQPQPQPSLAAAPPAPAPAGQRSAAAAAPTAAATGQVQFSVGPWAHIEVNGSEAGMTPPVSRLTLPAGTHTITLRNDDYAPYSVTVTVTPERPAAIRYQFAP